MTSVLFLTSNGTGLGHVTRCMAIARRFPAGLTPIIFTLSKGLSPVRQQGFYVEYFPSRNASNLAGGQWNARLALRLSALIEEYRPAVVAFDGTFPYRGLRQVLEANLKPAFVWIRRPMWQPDVDPEALTYSGLFDAVIEPGEFASAADEGPTVARREEALCVDPILFCDESELLSREESEAQLGLEPGRTHALIQLGEVPSYERDFLVQNSLTQILQGSDTQVAILESAISARFVVPSTVVKVAATYPIARLYPAFDFVISAAGYNSYHELIGFQVPAAFFPVRKPTDNQAARARYAEEVGVAVEVGLDTASAVETLMSEADRVRMTSRARELRFANGAEAAAEEIGRLASEREAESAGRGRTRRRLPEPGGKVVEGSEEAAISLAGASEEDLFGIDGVGPAIAHRIIEFRDERGGVSSIGDLAELTGVGPVMLERLSARLRP